MKDEIAVIAIVVLFAIALTVHVAIAVGLVRREKGWRGAVAFLAPPLAPYWAFRSHMPVRGGLWIVAVVGYVIARIVFRH